MNENFIKMLEGLKSPQKLEAIKLILAKYREASAVDNKFYSNTQKLIQVRDRCFSIIDASDQFLEALIRIEAASAYSIFKYILDEDNSDILIYHDGIHLSNNREGQVWQVPDELYNIYNLFLDHFISNIMFLAEKKFDVANNTLDAEIQGMRFNMAHGSIIVSGRPVIAIRKNLAQHANNSAEITGERYINSIGASKEQIEMINEIAYKGNYIIFGEVGSGKTTLLRYMANHRLDEKDNLCTIEDTKELNIDVPLSEITNPHASIHQLFVNTLRQYPSHVIIGETRTDEIVDILENALTINVGTTIHAGSFSKAIQRIVFMSLKREIPAGDMLRLTNAAIDCFIHMEKRKIVGMWVHKKEVIENIYDAYEEIK